MVATITKVKRRRLREDATWRRVVRLHEEFVRHSGKLDVDEEAGIIRGFKLCGWTSDNGRDYDPSAASRELYEGKPCYLNHCAKGQQRKVEDDIGVWIKAYVKEDGWYGDLKYDKAHAYAPRLVYRAKHLPENIGFSHDAETDPSNIEMRDGRPLVKKITEVSSVDLVADPATTNGLAEGKHAMKWTLKSLLESAKKAFTGKQKAGINRLLEDDAMTDPLAAEIDEPAGDPEDALSDGFRSGMYACVDAFCDGEMDLASAVGKIKELAKAHDNLVDKDGDTSEDDNEDEEDEVKESDDTDDEEDEEDEDEEETSKTESRLRRLERRDAARDLCEQLDFIPTKDQLADLVEITDPKRRKRIAESFAALAEKPAGKSRSGPRSRSGKTIRENRDKPQSAKDFVEQLTRS